MHSTIKTSVKTGVAVVAISGLAMSGVALAQTTDDPATESQPRWSPDRRRIAFVSDQTGLDQIYLLSLATTLKTNIL